MRLPILILVTVTVAILLTYVNYVQLSPTTRCEPTAPASFRQPAASPSLQLNATSMSVVILWVNGSEPAWLRARQQRCLSFYRSLGEDASHCNDDYWRVSRAREVGELLFLLRSLERNAPYLLHDVIVVISEFVRPPRYLRTCLLYTSPSPRDS